MFGNLIFTLLLVSLTAAQNFPTCNPAVVQWFPHPESCTQYIICYHGNPVVLPCAPNLHFSRRILKCMSPQEAQCDLSYACPSVDDPSNPIFVPDSEDCRRYHMCQNGQLVPRECDDGFWFDIWEMRCVAGNSVTCDDRTVINPGNPPTTPSPLPPDTSACHLQADLFDGTTYLKSMCIINANINYEAARARCHQHNMNLFIIDDSRVQIPFHEQTTELLRPHVRGFLWINGILNNATMNWEIFHSNGQFRGLLYNGVDWFQSPTVDGRTSGNCLRYTSQFDNPYQAMGVACTATSWLVCEHFEQISTPPAPTTPGTTTPVTTTTIATTTTVNNNTPPPGDGPNIAACWQRDDLFSNGVYLKSSCIMNTIVDYPTAEATCRYHNMELFVINSAQEQVAFRDSTNNFLQSGFLWINGMVDDSCGNWFAFDPYRRTMYGGIHWVQTDDLHGRTSGPCLRYTREFPPNWLSMGVQCNEASWFVCEYFGEGLTPGTPGTPTTTTPTIPTTTTTTGIVVTQPPNTGSCFLQADLFDGQTYLKTMCIMNRNINFEAAREACRDNHMNLFIINDSRVQVPFFNATTELLRPWNRGFVWINGRFNNVTDQWLVHDAEGNPLGPLYQGVDWFQNESINGSTSGECLRYTSQFDNPYQAFGVPCTATSWLVCEHFQQQSSTTPTTPLTTTTTRGLITTTPDPTPPSSPNVTACWAREHLRDGNGAYIKSQCIINTSENYDGARFSCRTLGMDLFVLDSTPMQIAFRESITRIVGALHPRGFLWINGRIDDDCGNWYVFDPFRREMWGGVHWVQTDTINGRISGDCLRFTGEFPELWRAMGVDCNSRSWYACEFFGEDL